MNIRVRLNMFKPSSRHTLDYMSGCFFAEMIDKMIDEVLLALLTKDLLIRAISLS